MFLEHGHLRNCGLDLYQDVVRQKEGWRVGACHLQDQILEVCHNGCNY